MILIKKTLIFLYIKKVLARLKRKNDICINVFCYEKGWAYPVHISGQEFKNYIDLLMISDK